MWNPLGSVPVDMPHSDLFSADGTSIRSLSRTATDHLSADDASVKTPSRKSSVRSSSSARRLSADDESLVPTIFVDGEITLRPP